jgi:hypothetical protein
MFLGTSKLMIYGRFLVFNNKPNDLTVHLNSIAQNDLILPPLPYVDDLRCTNLQVYGLDKDGNCEAGCGAICDLPSGQAKDVVITAVSEKERISNGHFRLNYSPPTLAQTNFISKTIGFENFIISGNNFGINSTVKVGNVLPYFEGPKCLCSGGLICEHDTTAVAASSSSGGRGCFLPKVEQTHKEIKVHLPQGIGTNINMVVISVNQMTTAKLSFEAPTIDIDSTSPTVVNTDGIDVITIKGTCVCDFFFFF